MRRHGPTRLLLLLVLALCGGCAGAAKLDPVLEDYARGNLIAAADAVSHSRLDGARESTRDGILFLLEQGKILQDAGRYAESDEAFERALARMQHYADSADVSITGELAQLVTTPAARAYRGSGWERILAETYRALNQLALGDLSEALVHCRRAYVHQVDTVLRHEKEIESARSEGQSRGVAMDDVLASPELQQEYESVQTRITPAYADWANPFTTWLTALLLWADGDLTNAAVDLRKAAGMAPGNRFIEQMLGQVDAGVPPGTPEGRVYVVFEGGLAPVREQTGLAIFTPQAGISTLTLPTLEYTPTGVASLELAEPGGARLATTEDLASIDSVVSADFQSRLPGIVMREMLSIVAKEVGTAQLQNQHGDLGLVLGSLWKLGTAKADTRTWRSPPAGVGIAVLDRPPGGVLRLSVLDGSGGRHLPTEVVIPAAPVVLVLARSPTLMGLAAHALVVVPAAPVQPEAPTSP